MRTGVVALALAVLAVAPVRPARAQFSTDARRVGMGGVSLTREGALQRFNPAYRAVKARPEGGGATPRFTIPIPLGLIDFLRDHPIGQWDTDPLFNPDSAAFNPVELMNLVLNPPIFYEIKKVPTPTNDVEFTIGKNAFVIDLGAAQALIPEDEFGMGSTSRLADVGFGFAGFNVGVVGFLHYEVGFTFDDALRGVLKEADSVAPNTQYRVLNDGVAQAGFAPTLSYAGRLTSDGVDGGDGLYLGAAVHWYWGIRYASVRGAAGFTTGTPVFGAPPTGLLDDTVYTANTAYGRGFGGDVGIVWVSGPLEVGFGINDIGATLTWDDTKVRRVYLDPVTDSVEITTLQNNIESQTELPITYVANAVLQMGTGLTVGGNIVNAGRGTVIHVGAEQRMGPFALRGGVSRDRRKKMQFGWGGGIRFGSIGLDVGFWTHSNSFATERGITMATSIAIY